MVSLHIDHVRNLGLITCSAATDYTRASSSGNMIYFYYSLC